MPAVLLSQQLSSEYKYDGHAGFTIFEPYLIATLVFLSLL